MALGPGGILYQQRVKLIDRTCSVIPGEAGRSEAQMHASIARIERPRPLKQRDRVTTRFKRYLRLPLRDLRIGRGEARRTLEGGKRQRMLPQSAPEQAGALP